MSPCACRGNNRNVPIFPLHRSLPKYTRYKFHALIPGTEGVHSNHAGDGSPTTREDILD
jgi:hypothetical protein